MESFSQDLFVITAPPASGKTYWIEAFFSTSQIKNLLVISPLRALADECRERWGKTITVMTPEEWLGNKVFSDVVIFDEFHLFFYWGDTFREKMWEAFYEITGKARLTFFLTATLSKEMSLRISEFKCQFETITWLNHGNQILKTAPVTYVKAPSRKWILDTALIEKSTGVKLIFAKYRKEVFTLEKYFVSRGHNCITCVGGESKFMSSRLKLNPTPDFIISTTVLSHGVNLPRVGSIFFTYPVQNIDFWIQMVARGGRRGEKYVVYALEKPFGLRWNPWKNYFHVFLLTIKQKCMRIRNAF